MSCVPGFSNFVFRVLVFRRSGVPAFRHSGVPCFSTSLNFPRDMSPKSHNAIFSAPRQFNSSYRKSLKIWRSSDFVRSYDSIDVFVFSSFYCNMICFTAVC